MGRALSTRPRQAASGLALVLLLLYVGHEVRFFKYPEMVRRALDSVMVMDWDGFGLERALVLLLLYVGHEVRFFKYPEMVRRALDSVMVMDWDGFGLERGVYNFTVVTAMLDIGRGRWGGVQRRSFNKYLLYMQRMLRLDVNLVVFVDPKGKPFVDWMRRGRENRTKVIVYDFTDLPYYSLRERIQEIMSSSEFQADNELVSKGLCESLIPEYDILQLSKLYFVNRAIDMDAFQTNYFVWLDAGYGHGDDVFPVNGIWVPNVMMDHPDQLTFIERDPGALAYREVKDTIHKMSINIIAGLFFGGGKKAFKEGQRLQQAQVEEWMKVGVIDDDQTMYMLMYYKNPSLFNLVRGDWDDVFKLFGKVPINTE